MALRSAGESSATTTRVNHGIVPRTRSRNSRSNADRIGSAGNAARASGGMRFAPIGQQHHIADGTGHHAEGDRDTGIDEHGHEPRHKHIFMSYQHPWMLSSSPFAPAPSRPVSGCWPWRPRGTFCVMDYTEILGQSQPRLSRHLRLLVEAGVIERVREGANVWFTLPPGIEPQPRPPRPPSSR